MPFTFHNEKKGFHSNAQQSVAHLQGCCIYSSLILGLRIALDKKLWFEASSRQTWNVCLGPRKLHIVNVVTRPCLLRNLRSLWVYWQTLLRSENPSGKCEKHHTVAASTIEITLVLQVRATYIYRCYSLRTSRSW